MSEFGRIYTRGSEVAVVGWVSALELREAEEYVAAADAAETRAADPEW